MIVFLDFEASSLGKKSVPIEVAWVFEDGRSRSLLIRPAADWDDWAADAEAIHGISRELLASEGVPVEQVAREMVEVLTGHELYASAPSWDGKWLSVLLRAGGFPRHALRLGKSRDAFMAAARELTGAAITETELSKLIDGIVEESKAAVPAHRALADATLELTRWKLVRDAARKRMATER
ncbi:transcriptional regulator [Rhizobium sp. WYJ-E13]|uniref:transcriptional regulator n=1 Tax=Rhizobium sp. WYJ-E13 TaxID=2849093 RepID=UPI001C1EAE69|nr:transcriptional regulator [Rhizobium sp. WYJ-E13]QWW70583.1 transcriptional regulator [Rhizobium sp. WYJ-E13]